MFCLLWFESQISYKTKGTISSRSSSSNFNWCSLVWRVDPRAQVRGVLSNHFGILRLPSSRVSARFRLCFFSLSGKAQHLHKSHLQNALTCGTLVFSGRIHQHCTRFHSYLIQGFMIKPKNHNAKLFYSWHGSARQTLESTSSFHHFKHFVKKNAVDPCVRFTEQLIFFTIQKDKIFKKFFCKHSKTLLRKNKLLILTKKTGLTTRLTPKRTVFSPICMPSTRSIAFAPAKQMDFAGFPSAFLVFLVFFGLFLVFFWYFFGRFVGFYGGFVVLIGL